MGTRAPRLPGIHFPFKTASRPLDEVLPRMDVAGFVGFVRAEIDQKPDHIHTPKLVEDAAQFAKTFGDDLELAWDERSGARVYSQLGPAVRAFFQNGGRRCWVVGVPAPTSERVTINTDMFLDGALIDTPSATLLSEANFLRYQQLHPCELKGAHALLGVDEVTIVAVPDASLPGWSSAGDNTPPLAAAAAEPATPGAFHACADIAAPLLDPITLPPEGESLHISWTAVAGQDTGYELQSAAGPDFARAATIFRGPGDALAAASGGRVELTVRGWQSGATFYRVRALRGDRAGPWSNSAGARLGGQLQKLVVEPPAPPAPDEKRITELLRLHVALINMCAARGDMLAVLSLPATYREREAVAHTLALGRLVPDARTRSFGALYHPWLYTREGADVVTRLRPPDGAICGMIAGRTRERGAWAAPANQTLRNVVALAPAIAPKLRLLLQEGAVNLVRQEPRGFVALGANTLAQINPARLLDDVSLPPDEHELYPPWADALRTVAVPAADPELRPLNVRRLLSLLRRLALRRGMTYIFEPDSPAFRRMVQRGFEELLEDMYLRGAFAGATAGDAFQVSVGAPSGRSRTRDGEIVVELRVAPARPLSFLTVRLVQSGDRALAAEET